MQLFVLTVHKKDSNMNCRLCLSNNELIEISGKDNREYMLCNNCKLVNVHPEYFLNEHEEKERYLEHQNGIHHKGYVNFLNRAIEPALDHLNSSMTGLDYGCGYAPTISKLLRKYEIKCENYDPIFFKKELKKKYDFIFSTEAFEHFFQPAKEIEKLVGLLKSSGILIIMTERWENRLKFGEWYYTRDPSHVAFYHNLTFEYICSNYLFEKIYDDNKRVMILRKI
jgi:SAM-dependent methyltransferase